MLTYAAPMSDKSDVEQLADMRLRLGLQGSLIPFATLAFEPQRQFVSRELPSPLVFRALSTHFTATKNVLLP